jgi:hypothetical protein
MTKRVTAAEQIAWVDWRREVERWAFLFGVGPLPPPSFGEPQWLKTTRAAMEARK